MKLIVCFGYLSTACLILFKCLKWRLSRGERVNVQMWKWTTFVLLTSHWKFSKPIVTFLGLTHFPSVNFFCITVWKKFSNVFNLLFILGYYNIWRCTEFYFGLLCHNLYLKCIYATCVRTKEMGATLNCITIECVPKDLGIYFAKCSAQLRTD